MSASLLTTRPNPAKRLAVLAAPGLVVLFLRTFSGAGPALAPAATPAGADPALFAPPLIAGALNDNQKRAQEWVNARPINVSLHSPFDHPSPSPTPVPTEPAVVDSQPSVDAPEPQAPVRQSQPTLTLSGVLGSSSGTLAVINGRIYRIGQSVETGWILNSIDAARRTARITGPNGEVIFLETPR